MSRIALARILVVAAVATDIVVLVGGATLKPGYSHTANFISELNATGTPWSQQIGWFGFVPLGSLIAAFLFVAAPAARVRGASRFGYWLLFSQAIAYLSMPFAACDAGCPLEGSSSQAMHNLVGLLTYFAAGIGMVLLAFAPSLGKAARSALALAGIAWLSLFLLMVDPALQPSRGLLQRIAEAILCAVLVFIAWRMLRVEDAEPAAQR